MNEDFLKYYHEELDYLRRAGRDFSADHPTTAGALRLGERGSDDPMVTRLIESFAFLTARLNQQLNANYEEIAQSLLNIVYPEINLPIPALSTVQFVPPDSLNDLSFIKRGFQLHARAEDNASCTFQTCYDVQVLPLQIQEVELLPLWDLELPACYLEGSTACLKIRLSSMVPLEKWKALAIDNLRFYLNVQPHYAHSLYAYLFQSVRQIILHDPSTQQYEALPKKTLQPVGFAENERLWPQVNQSFSGFHYLMEYSAFPDKFMYFDIDGLKQKWEQLESGDFELLLLLDKYEKALIPAVSSESLLLNCTPIINLFEQTAEPITVEMLQTDYPIEANRQYPKDAIEVYKIKKLEAWPDAGGKLKVQPAYRQYYGAEYGEDALYWEMLSKPHLGEDHRIRFSGGKASELIHQKITVGIDLLCTNRDLPSCLPYGGESSIFSYQATESQPAMKLRCLRQPTAILYPKYRAAYWELLAVLSGQPNFLADETNAKEHLKTLIQRLNCSQSAQLTQLSKQIRSVSIERKSVRYSGEGSLSFVHGVEVVVNFEATGVICEALYLFGTVLSQVLKQYAALNSFIHLRFAIDGKGDVAAWGSL